MGLIVNQHWPWDPDDGDSTEWVPVDGGWRPAGSTDGPKSLTGVVSPREDCHVQITTNGQVTIDEVVSALREPGPDADGVAATVDGELFGGFVGVGWIPLDEELSWDLEDAVPAGRLLAELSISGGGFTSGTMAWKLVEVRPGLLCDSYHDDHGNGFSCNLFESDPVDYGQEALRVVEDAAYDDVATAALALAIVDGGGSWTASELGEDNGNEYSVDFAEEIVDQLPLPSPPMARTYWVTRRLLGGVYPGAPTEVDAMEKLGALSHMGVTLFVDLTEPGEANHVGVPLAPYEHLLEEFETAPRRVSIPVPDMTPPSDDQVREAIRVIDEEIDHGGRVYVHCWGGRGRTGSVLGCWLAEQPGIDDALHELNRIRGPQIDDDRDRERIPQTSAQRELVARWSR